VVKAAESAAAKEHGLDVPRAAEALEKLIESSAKALSVLNTIRSRNTTSRSLTGAP
jgi:hypothetical protein